MPDQTDPKPVSKKLRTLGFLVLLLFVVLFLGFAVGRPLLVGDG